ncbi:MAG: 16S rRNA (adenine(1518)-N(6)/adenine(1519)-N(6))-dimethyltransferase RsmA [Acidimicrobiales bacterium]
MRPSRALGQNFLADPNTARRIARLAGVGPGDRVVEIGAGLGSLTLALAETGATVVAVEVDKYLVPVLAEVVDPVGVKVVRGDALDLDWDSVLRESAPKPGNPIASPVPAPRPTPVPPASGWVLVSNLPYNVATPLVVRILEEVPVISRMLVMVQAEVGERLAAHAGEPAYGAVSVKVAYWATASVVGRVPATVFVPQPRVESVLVAIGRRPTPAVDPAVVTYRRLVEVVRAGFAQRRKMLRGTLAGVVEEGAFADAGVQPTARAEELDVEAWGRIAAWPTSGITN